MKEKCAEAHFIAYADDIIIAAQEKNHLKKAFTILEEDLLKINLVINRDKTEFISTDESDLVINHNLSLPNLPRISYLDQKLDRHGNPLISFSVKHLGPICSNLLNKNMTIPGKIWIFKLFIRSKFTHLISFALIFDHAKQAWKDIRKIIFR